MQKEGKNEIEDYVNSIKIELRKKIIKYYKDKKIKLCTGLCEIEHNINIPLTHSQFCDVFQMIPFKFITYTKTSNDEYILSYHFKMLEDIIQKLKEESIISEKQRRLTPKEMQDMNGNEFEDIVIFSLISFPRFNLNVATVYNVDSVINILEEDEKENNNKSKSKKNNIYNTKELTNQSIVFRQYNPTAKNYDLAVLINKNNEYYFVLFQISINKAKKNILYRQKIQKDCKEIKRNLLQKFNIDISEQHFYFHYIFCKERQNSDGLFVCNGRQLSYFFYSIEEWTFVEKTNSINLLDEKAGVFYFDSKESLIANYFDSADFFIALGTKSTDIVLNKKRERHNFEVQIDQSKENTLIQYVSDFKNENIKNITYKGNIKGSIIYSYPLPSSNNLVVISELKNGNYIILNDKHSYYYCKTKKIDYSLINSPIILYHYFEISE